MEKRTWAEIDLDALAHNMREIRKITNPDAQIMAVVRMPMVTALKSAQKLFLKTEPIVSQ